MLREGSEQQLNPVAQSLAHTHTHTHTYTERAIKLLIKVCYAQDVKSSGGLHGNKLNYLLLLCFCLSDLNTLKKTVSKIKTRHRLKSCNLTWRNDDDLSAADVGVCPPTCQYQWWWDSVGRRLRPRTQCWWAWPRCSQSARFAPSCWWCDSSPETTPALTHRKILKMTASTNIKMLRQC